MKNNGQEIRVKVELIPDYTEDCLAAATLKFFIRSMDNPENREEIEKRVAMKHAINNG